MRHNLETYSVTPLNTKWAIPYLFYQNSLKIHQYQKGLIIFHAFQ